MTMDEVNEYCSIILASFPAKVLGEKKIVLNQLSSFLDQYTVRAIHNLVSQNTNQRDAKASTTDNVTENLNNKIIRNCPLLHLSKILLH
jgi:predicted metal-dependent peptidase